MSKFEKNTNAENQILSEACPPMTPDEAYEQLSSSENWAAYTNGEMSETEGERFINAIAMATEALRLQTTEGLNTALYHRMFDSQERFKRELMTQSSEKILESAYEYVKREDLLASLEYYDLDADDAVAMLALPDPLASAFDWYENHPCNASGTDLDRAWIAIEGLAASLT